MAGGGTTGGTLAKKMEVLLHPNLSISLTAFLSSSSSINVSHAHLIVSGRITDTFAASRLLAAAAANPSAGDLSHATRLFNSLASPTLFSYNTMIRASSQTPHPIQSLHLYLRLLRSGISPDNLTFPFLLRSCAALRLAAGTAIHCHAAKFGFAGDVFVVNNAITMYSSLPDMASARLIFEERIEIADVVSWTAIITGHAINGDIDVAQSLFHRAPSRNLMTWNTMLAGYARSGRALDAYHLFDQMSERNAASWGSLISGFVRAGLLEKALALFGKMARDGAEPNESLLASVLSACAQLRDLERGRSVHRYMESLGIDMGVILGSALVDMYGKCGDITNAIRVFDAMPARNIYTWNSLIAGLAMSGAGSQALTLLHKMRLAGATPNAITFVDLLSACSHNGLVEEGRKLFEEMTRVYGIAAEEEHYGCVVDLLGRAGLIKEALDFIWRMHVVDPHYPGVWGALANACRIHGEIELGEEVARRLIEVEPCHGGRYIHLSNIYGDARRWNDMESVRRLLKTRPAAKAAGRSSVRRR